MPSGPKDVPSLCFRFGEIARPVVFVDCAELLPAVQAILRGWAIEEVPRSDQEPCITLRGDPGGYWLESDWSRAPVFYDDQVDVVCSFVVELVWALIASQSSLLCLHAAAAAFAGKLLVFPNTYRAGKSTFTVQLAAAGVRVFADDVLPIRAPNNLAVAPGVLPRLRLPLPDAANRGFADFVQRHAGLCNQRYLYVDLDRPHLASFGETAPIGAFILLRRSKGQAASLEPMTSSEALRRVILRNFARDTAAADILDRLQNLIGSAACFKLRYSDGEAAAALLKERFGAWPADPAPQAPAVTPEAPPRLGATTSAARSAGHFIRNPTIVEKTVDQDLFLVNERGDSIYNLNPLGRALWRLLDEWTGQDEAIALLCAAFPEVPPQQIADDVARLMHDLADKGLIESD